MIKRLLQYLFYLVILSACEKINTEEINNLNGGKILVIGHGGSGFQTGRNPIPSNSSFSIEKAIELYGADGVEVDIQLSKDKVIMLYHNDLLETNTLCQGCIADHMSTQLTDCRYREDFSVNTMLNEKLITLEEIFKKYSELKVKPYYFLDNKDYPNCIKDNNIYNDDLAQTITELIDKYGLADQVGIESSGVELLTRVKKINPSIITYLDTDDFEKGLSIAVENNLNGIIIENNKINKDQVKKAHSYGIKVGLFLVKDRKSTFEAVNKHPDLIQTDNIKLLQEFLK